MQQALAAATPGDRIFVAAGTYKPSQQYDFSTGATSTAGTRFASFKIPSGVEVYGGFPAGATGTADAAAIAARDFAANPTILSGDFNNDDNVTGTGQTLSFSGVSENAYHVLYTRSLSGTTTVDGFTVQGGAATGSFPDNYGGGWLNQITSSGSSTVLNVRNMVFTHNSGTSFTWGGGMYNDLQTLCVFELNISDSRFIDNSAYNGSALFTHSRLAAGNGATFNVNLTGLEFSGNNASNGGAYRLESEYAVINASCRNTQFRSNYAVGGAGVSVSGYNSPNSRANFDAVNTVFWGNVTTGNAGAISIAGNNSVLNLTNCTIAANQAGGPGGGIGTGSSPGPMTIRNTIFAGNAALSFPSIQAGNDASNPLNIDYCLVPDADASAFAFPGAIVGSNMIYATGPGVNNFSTGDLTLFPTSAAINAGSNMALSASITTDLAGNTRIADGTIDMGAYEFVRQPARDFYVKATGGSDTNGGTSFDDAYATLEQALGQAVNTTAGSKIYVAAGTYKPSRTYEFFTGTPSGSSPQQLRTFYIPSGTEVYGSFPAGATGTADAAAIAARDFAANTTILSGDFNDDDQVTGSGQALSITQTSDNAYHVVYTRAVSNTTVVDGFTIQGGSTFGGALNQGGGWYNDGQQNRGASSPTVRNCRFFGNAAQNGPAMANAGFSGGEVNPTIENCIFDRNIGQNGAGVYIIATSSGTTTARITNCVFSGGEATGDGGGIYVSAGSGTSDVQVVNSLFSGNFANQGAAAYHNQSTGSYINCTFVNNSSNGQALLNSGGTVSVQNGIFWQNLNSGNAESSIDNSGTTTVTHTLVGEADETAFTGGNTGLTPGTGMIYGQDPLFTSGTFTLQGGSPAIDAGNSAAVPVSATVDLAGEVRIRGNAVDLGAYESNIPVITLTANSLEEDAGYNTIVFTFTSSVTPTSALSINFSISGTATYNQDYYYIRGSSDFDGTKGSVMIPAGETGTELVFQTKQDAILESDETIIVTIEEQPSDN